MRRRVAARVLRPARPASFQTDILGGGCGGDGRRLEASRFGSDGGHGGRNERGRGGSGEWNRGGLAKSIRHIHGREREELNWARLNAAAS